jgi:hypothetical protein
VPEIAALTIPPVVVFRREFAAMLEMVRLVVDAVPLYIVPLTESAVEDAYAICAVDDEWKPDWNQMGVLVAFTVTP